MAEAEEAAMAGEGDTAVEEAAEATGREVATTVAEEASNAIEALPQ